MVSMSFYFGQCCFCVLVWHYIKRNITLLLILLQVIAFTLKYLGFRIWHIVNFEPHSFLQLLEMNSSELIAEGNNYIASREDAANKFLDKSFKIRLGRGLYGECLVRTCLHVFWILNWLISNFNRTRIDVFLHLRISLFQQRTFYMLNVNGY